MIRAAVLICCIGITAFSQVTEYKQLREAALTEAIPVENVVIRRDVGSITLKNGFLAFAPPVLGRVTLAVFVGEGQLTLQPELSFERDHLKMVLNKDSVMEPFERAVFVFTDKSYEELRGKSRIQEPSREALDELRDVRQTLRNRPVIHTLTQSLLYEESVDNVEADTLADLLNPSQPGFFSAYIHSRKYSDLRLHVRPRGALPGLSTSEEVALINVNAEREDDGVWYSAHLMDEYRSGANLTQAAGSVSPQAYRIHTKILKNEHLEASAEIEFKALREGDRVIKFDLLPNLRVSGVKGSAGPVEFIQEDRKSDGSLYALMPAPMPKGQNYSLTIEYAGDQVIHKAGGGNFYVEARSSWYPSLNSFRDQAKYELTFESPRQYTLVASGKPVKQERQGDNTVSQWVSEVPMAVAGFNYGQFKKKEITVKDFPYTVEGYAGTSVPDYLQGAQEDMVISTTSLLDQAMTQAEVSLRVFDRWFGRAPYGRLAVTQQPDFNFGQSWPELVYLPLSAFLDSTVRWRLMNNISTSMNNFVQQVTPHEVSHQWWGHMVGWNSYRDQWLSEGFADFSAGIFLQATNPNPDKYRKYLETSRDLLLDKNNFGVAANDAGPLVMGLRLITPHAQGAYQRVIYQKGGMVLHMLRSLMWDAKTGDKDFMDMMHDFVHSHLYQAASTESFMAVVDKHMSPKMDLAGDGHITWFFRQWVYGTEVPRLKFTSTLTPEGNGMRLKASLTQSGVSADFLSLVPLYVEMDNRQVRVGSIRIQGNSTVDIDPLFPQNAKKVTANAFYDVLAQK